MQKNRKRSPQPPQTRVSRPRYPVTLPQVVSIDVLAAQPDEELINRLRSLEEDRTKVLDADARLEAKPWEEEVAYIRRELQIRRIRRETHDKYVKQLEREFAESEAGLPAADLDNTHFLRLAGEIN